MEGLYEKYKNTLHLYYRQSKSTLDPARIWTNLDEMNSHYIALISHMDEAMNKNRTALEARIAMQKAMKKADMDEQALAIFYQDQFAHYFTLFKGFKKDVGKKDSPFVTHLTTKHILLMLRLCRDVKIIDKVPLLAHVTFISNFISTTRQSEISIQSLRKKYSKLDKRIVGEVKIILEKMIDKLGEYRVDST